MYGKIYDNVQKWIYRNARYIEICLWKYYFENGTKKAVVEALMQYQNEDGGFGNAIEPDNWNPNSSPISTDQALQILMSIGFNDMSSPIYKGIWKYLESGKDMVDYGWRFTIQSTDSFPHAQWWNYNEEYNKKEYCGVTATFSSFVLRYGDKTSELYKKADEFATKLINVLQNEHNHGDMGLWGLVVLVDTLKELKPTQYDYAMLDKLIAEKVNNAIEHDTQKWAYYGVRPSDFIRNPQSKFYADNKDIVKKELDYLVNTLPENDVWPITWTWLDNMEKYNDQFKVSEIWWKAIKAMEKVQFLKSFKELV